MIKLKSIIKSEKLRYFIFDTGVTGKDIDFVQYDWSRSNLTKSEKETISFTEDLQKFLKTKNFIFLVSVELEKLLIMMIM